MEIERSFPGFAGRLYLINIYVELIFLSTFVGGMIKGILKYKVVKE